MTKVGHLGNEDMWHVPLVMDWHRLDASLVREGQYPGAPGAARPTWANKLLLYRTSANGGVAEKRGYFVVPKLEELVCRWMAAFADAAYEGFAPGPALRRWSRRLRPDASQAAVPASSASNTASAAASSTAAATAADSFTGSLT